MKSVLRSVVKKTASAVLVCADKILSVSSSPKSIQTRTPPTEKTKIEKTRSVRSVSVLVCDHSSIGDIVCSLPAVSLLMKEFPDADFSFASNSRTNALLTALFPDCAVFNTDSGFLSILKTVRARRFDLVFVLNHSLPDRALGILGRGRVSVGYLSGKKKIESRNLNPALFKQVKNLRHLADVRLDVCRTFLGRELSEDETAEFSALKRLACAAGDETQKPRILLCPFSKWPSKNWTREGFVRVGRKIIELVPDCELIVEGTAADRQRAVGLAGEIGSGCRSEAGDNDIVGLVRSIAGSRMLVSVDSAPVHIANALGVPLLALYGPTPAELCGPWLKSDITAVISNPESAKINYAKGDWALDSNARLMHELSEDEVLESLEKLLRRVFNL